MYEVYSMDGKNLEGCLGHAVKKACWFEDFQQQEVQEYLIVPSNLSDVQSAG